MAKKKLKRFKYMSKKYYVVMNWERRYLTLNTGFKQKENKG